MDDPTTTATLDQADEDILTYTASDEALEAAAGSDAQIDTIAIASHRGAGGLCCFTWQDSCPG
jgi:hypothetical protein